MKYPSKWRYAFQALAVIVTILQFTGVFSVFIPLLNASFSASSQAASVGIIGGADGPTAVYVTTKLNVLPQLLSLLPFYLACAAGFLLFTNKPRFRTLCIVLCAASLVLQLAAVVIFAVQTAVLVQSVPLLGSLLLRLLTPSILFSLALLIVAIWRKNEKE